MSGLLKKTSDNEILLIARDRFLTCPIHLEIFKDPVQGPCGHVFCRKCIIACLNIKQVCPVCQAKMDQNQLYFLLFAKQIMEENSIIENNMKTENKRRYFLAPIKNIVLYYREKFWNNRWDLKIIIISLILFIQLVLMNEVKANIFTTEEITIGTCVLLFLLNYVVKH